MIFNRTSLRRLSLTGLLFIIGLSVEAEVFEVNSQQSFDTSLATVAENDTIAWQDGTYEDIFMNIKTSNLVVMALNPGEVIFTGRSWLVVKGDYVTVTGLQFLDGDIGTENVLESYGNHVHFNNLNINGYTSYKYLVIRAECRNNKVTYCNFENRLNLDDKNILSVLVDATEPGYHLIQYCSFKNFDGIGKDQGIEPIRIGLSTQGEFISRTVVEYCYFTQCNGDGEIISNKARQNVFRYNTFEDNPVAELTLRHGDEGVVYGNFFLNGMGGVRIKEGQNHAVYNNYFSGLTRYSLNLQNYNVDPLDDILIAYNTFVDTEVIRLGGAGDHPPRGVTFANNIFAAEGNNLFTDPTGTESWIGNIYQGALGISTDPGLIENDPELLKNSAGFYSLASTSPAIDAGTEGYPALPVYEGLDIDSDLLLDLMKGPRPSVITEKDLGAIEYDDNGFVKPHVTEVNTGPSYFRKKAKLTTDPQGLGMIQVEPKLDEYEKGTIVTITAVPIEGYEFYYWSGDKTSLLNPDTIVMNNDRHVVAHFQEIVTAISSRSRSKVIEIYPNPVKDRFKLSSEVASSKEFVLFNSQGLEVKKFSSQPSTSDSESVTYDVSDLPPGLYFLGQSDNQFNSVKERGTIKLIKL